MLTLFLNIQLSFCKNIVLFMKKSFGKIEDMRVIRIICVNLTIKLHNSLGNLTTFMLFFLPLFTNKLHHTHIFNYIEKILKVMKIAVLCLKKIINSTNKCITFKLKYF